VHPFTTSQNHIYLDPSKLAAAVKPAKVLIDEEIVDLQKEIGLTEMKRQLRMKLSWMQNAFVALKKKIANV